MMQCRGCGLTVTIPQPAGDRMARYYPAGYYGAQERNRFPRIIEWLQRILYGYRARRVQRCGRGGPGRVLDVGCGRGLLLREFQRQGWEVQGTELSDLAARYPREVLRLPVHTGRLESLPCPENHFDALVLWHVLEHVADPHRVLGEAGRFLKPGGILMVGVPNFGGREARLSRDKWFHLDVPRHVTHFTHDTLRDTLDTAGFRERQVWHFAPEYDCFSWVQSLLNRMGLPHNLLYDLLRARGAKVARSDHANAFHRTAALVLGAFLGVLSLPATTVAGLMGQGATLTLLAEKKT